MFKNLRVFVCLLLCTFTLVFFCGQKVIAEANGVEWGYRGATKADNWGNLAPEFATCKVGSQQSPINISQPIEAKLDRLQLDYSSTPIKILNNGHTVQVNVNSGSTLTLNDQQFELLQVHFHYPSEHKIDGKSFPMEAHFVHQSKSGGLAVVGVLIESGSKNTALQPVWKVLPSKKQAETKIAGTSLKLADLIPRNKKSFQYFGSLTTPPCTENVQWVVLENPIELSSQQIRQFQKIFPLNARPVQPLNRRFLLK